eukprot:1859409-Prymnesium_polylepis.1
MCSQFGLPIPRALGSQSRVGSWLGCRLQTAKAVGSNPGAGLFRPAFAIENIPALKWGRASGGGH